MTWVGLSSGSTIASSRLAQSDVALLLSCTTWCHDQRRQPPASKSWRNSGRISCQASAANSLNQTLYFLRREIDPFYDEDESYEYLSNKGELVWLDRGKTRIASVCFAAEASRALRVIDLDPDPARLAVRQYAGKFAAEFEYEDWAHDWRDQIALLVPASRTVTAAGTC